MSIAAIGTLASLAGSAVGAVGAAQAASARADAANTQSQIDAKNQQTATQNAQWAAQAGEQQAKTSGDKARLMQGAIKAGEAANGVDVNSGSNLDVQESQAKASENSALIIRQNAARDAYAYNNQSWSYGMQQNLDQQSAAADEAAGSIGAAGTLISGVGSAADQWTRYKMGL